jgi:glycosyltransferase involved in cell wall biosynthesis
VTPTVSICVPNLNTRPFLPERFDTIQKQTFQDWELLVYDSYSKDGAWEYICGLARKEARLRAWQGPRQGTPGSWSPCVKEARGTYVYIATSDDTMAPDCLAKLVAALEANPDCDIAHCTLRVIDEHGGEVADTGEWWSRGSAFAQSSGPLRDRRHIRRAPLDGLLHLMGGSVYVSITQLLIRRTLFDRVGFFESTWGSAGDFNWNMRAGLVANTVHVPDTWGGWRVHSSQATAGVRLGSREHAARVDAMIADAIAVCGRYLSEPVRTRLESDWAADAKAWRDFRVELAERRTTSPVGQRAYALRRLLSGSRQAREYLASRVRARSPADWVRERLRTIDPRPLLEAIDPAGVSPSHRTL